MRLGIDLDGCLVDFNSGFIERCIAVTGRDLFPPRPFDITIWNYPEFYNYTTEEISAVWDSIKKDPVFWLNLPAYPETEAALGVIRKRIHYHFDDVYFITARPGVHAKRQTEDWLLYHLPSTMPTVLVSSHKGKCASALQLDKYLDDKWENVMDVALTTGTEVYLLDRPWNQRPAYSSINRISTISEMF